LNRVHLRAQFGIQTNDLIPPSIVIIVVLVIAGLIAIMDLFFQAVFVNFIPSLFK